MSRISLYILLEQIRTFTLELDSGISLGKASVSDRFPKLIHRMEMILPRSIDDLKQHPSLELEHLQTQKRIDLRPGGRREILLSERLLIVVESASEMLPTPLVEFLDVVDARDDLHRTLVSTIVIPLVHLDQKGITLSRGDSPMEASPVSTQVRSGA